MKRVNRKEKRKALKRKLGKGIVPHAFYYNSLNEIK